MSEFPGAEFFRETQDFFCFTPEFFPCYAVIFSVFCPKEVCRNPLRQHAELLVPLVGEEKTAPKFFELNLDPSYRGSTNGSRSDFRADGSSKNGRRTLARLYARVRRSLPEVQRRWLGASARQIVADRRLRLQRLLHRRPRHHAVVMRIEARIGAAVRVDTPAAAAAECDIVATLSPCRPI